MSSKLQQQKTSLGVFEAQKEIKKKKNWNLLDFRLDSDPDSEPDPDPDLLSRKRIPGSGSASK